MASSSRWITTVRMIAPFAVREQATLVDRGVSDRRTPELISRFARGLVDFMLFGLRRITPAARPAPDGPMRCGSLSAGAAMSSHPARGRGIPGHTSSAFGCTWFLLVTGDCAEVQAIPCGRLWVEQIEEFSDLIRHRPPNPFEREPSEARFLRFDCARSAGAAANDDMGQNDASRITAP
jgi:hypothetical protein